MPDFEILWGEWGHIELKSGVDRPYGTFCLYGGTLRPVVTEKTLFFKPAFEVRPQKSVGAKVKCNC